MRSACTIATDMFGWGLIVQRGGIQWIHICVSILTVMTKSAALRIRIEPSLHQQFISTCKAQDVKASQVLRDFMRQYVEHNAQGKQSQLFTSTIHGGKDETT